MAQGKENKMIDGMLRNPCPDCGEYITLENCHVKSTGYYHAKCRECYLAEHRARSKQFTKDHPIAKRSRNLKHKFGITYAQYVEILAK